MPPILTPKEAKRYYKWSLWTRPAITYVMVTCVWAMVGTICYLLLVGKASLTDASALLMTIFGAFTPVLTSIVLGKSYERARGVNSENEAIQNTIPPNPIPDNSDASPSSIQGLQNIPSSAGGSLPFNPDDADDALHTLRQMDVSGYESQVADDNPPLPKPS